MLRIRSPSGCSASIITGGLTRCQMAEQPQQVSVPKSYKVGGNGSNSDIDHIPLVTSLVSHITISQLVTASSRKVVRIFDVGISVNKFLPTIIDTLFTREFYDVTTLQELVSMKRKSMQIRYDLLHKNKTITTMCKDVISKCTKVLSDG